MRKHFSSGYPYGADVEIGLEEIGGSGGHALPVISLPLRLDFWLHPTDQKHGAEFLTLSGRLWVAGLFQPHSRVIQLNRTLWSRFQEQKSNLFYLEFPVSPTAIEVLEAQRNGGDLKFTLDARISVRNLRMWGDPPPEGSFRPLWWGYGGTDEVTMQAELVVPRESWLRVLKGVGYGQVHIMEFPAAPLDACATLDHSFKALQQAQSFHQRGQYDDAVGKCRVALDQFFEFADREQVEGEKTVIRRVPTLKKSWETRLGASTFKWLDEALGAIKEASNKSHHSPNSHFGQAESQMVIAITTAVVAYAARTVEKNAEK